MTDTRSYEDVSTDPPEAQGRPSDLVKDDLPDAVGGEHSEQLDDQRLLEDIEEALKDVVDPELGINVVDLGLIYGLAPRRRRFLDHRHDADLGCLPADGCDRGPDPDGAGRTGRPVGDQLGLDAPVGHGDDHRRRSRPTARFGLQRLSALLLTLGSGRRRAARAETLWSASARHALGPALRWVSSILGFCACSQRLPEPFTGGALRRVAERGWSRRGGDHLLRVAAGVGCLWCIG